MYVPFNAAHFYDERNTPPGGKTEWQVPARYLEDYGWSADEPDERRRYAAVLTALDAAIGRILDSVDDLTLRDRTFVFLMSDNGGGIDRRTAGHVTDGGGLRGGITQCLEGGIRVPAMARWPGHIPAGSVCDAILSSLDLLPTFVSAAGGEIPSDRKLDGVDISEVLAGGGGIERELFWTFREQSAARDGNWKLFRPEPDAAWELFDLSRDRGETNNLATDCPQIVSRLSAKFDAWLLEAQRVD